MSNRQPADGPHDTAIHIPMTFRRRSGRKEIIIPDDPDSRQESQSNSPDYHEALVIAISRAHRWLRLLHSGKYRSINEMANKLRVSNAYMRRLLRFTLLAPDIIANILDGREPEGFSQNKLVGAIPAVWQEQRQEWSLVDHAADQVL